LTLLGHDGSMTAQATKSDPGNAGQEVIR